MIKKIEFVHKSILHISYQIFFILLIEIIIFSPALNSKNSDKQASVQGSKENLKHWNANAVTWDQVMADGNLFQKTIVEPQTLQFLDIKPGMKVLDIGCGNGQMSRLLAKFGAIIVAIDGSQEMIRLANQRSDRRNITYYVADVTKPKDLQFLESSHFDVALCNMALMDIPEIKPVFQEIYRVLKNNGVFVFSITHPCFDRSVGPRIIEVHEKEGLLTSKYNIKVEKYIIPSIIKVKVLPSFPNVHFHYHRPLQSYLNMAFQEGFIMNGVAEPSLSRDKKVYEPKEEYRFLSHEIPAVLIVKLQKYLR